MSQELIQQIREVTTQQAIREGQLQEKLLVSLATEIAMDIQEVPVIIANHGLTLEQFEALAKTPRFGALLAEQTIEWQSARKAEDRIALKMKAMVETALPDIYTELVKPGLSAPKVELVKTLMKGGGIGVEAKGAVLGEQVKIVINMGAERAEKSFTIDHNAEEAA